MQMQNDSEGIGSKTFVAMWSLVGVFALGCVAFISWRVYSDSQVHAANGRVLQAVETANEWLTAQSSDDGEAIEQQLSDALNHQYVTEKGSADAVVSQVKQRRKQLAEEKRLEAERLAEENRLETARQEAIQSETLHRRDSSPSQVAFSNKSLPLYSGDGNDWFRLSDRDKTELCLKAAQEFGKTDNRSFSYALFLDRFYRSEYSSNTVRKTKIMPPRQNLWVNRRHGSI